LLREGLLLIVTTEEWNMRQTTGTRKNPGEKIVKDINPAKVAPKAFVAYMTSSKLRREPSVRRDSYY
jgi:hypothetical protein